MRYRNLFFYFLILLICGAAGCTGLYYSRTAPEAKDFHAKRIAVLSVECGVHQAAAGLIEPAISAVLTERGWFTDVISLEKMNQKIQESDDLRKTTTEYLAKLKAVHYSDPEMSKRIGEIAQTDALVIAGVDYWEYTTDKDDKIAKVGLNVQVVDCPSGKIMWMASHINTPTYLLLKPKLEDVAKDLFNKMIGYMPH